jgi:transmembrane sensor
MKDLELEDFDQHLSSYKEDFQPDVAAGQRRLRARIGGVSTRQAAVRRLGRPAWFGMAAAVLLLLAAGYFMFTGDTTTFSNDTNAPMAVNLPDGTKVLLQQGAELGYGEKYNQQARRITLAGQAFFEVHKDKTRPFLVNTEETELRVTGTAFNLRINGEELEVEVSEGSVELHRRGEVTAVAAKHRGLSVAGKKCFLAKAENLNRHAWRTGRMTFQGTPLAEVVQTIRNNYGLSVSYDSDCDFPLSGAFAGNDPLGVLRSIAQLGGGELTENPEGSWVLEDICE